ncbi:MAG: twin-arginine translocation signal domain-containing protein [Xanthomonadales bacterium]|nr:twin-arginine translocation signal domain-containing protein [Xanthomonadales bacterium]
MSGESTSRRNFLRQLSCALCAGGASTLLPQLNLISSALAQTSVPGYKALVCVYFAGGNDAWNF